MYLKYLNPIFYQNRSLRMENQYFLILCLSNIVAAVRDSNPGYYEVYFFLAREIFNIAPLAMKIGVHTVQLVYFVLPAWDIRNNQYFGDFGR